MNLRITNTILRIALLKKLDRFYQASRSPYATQNRLLMRMLRKSKKTRIYKDLGLDRVKDLNHFNELIHSKNYEFYKPYIIDVMKGDNKALFLDKLIGMGVTSGTTSCDMQYNGRRIPYNQAMIRVFKNLYAISAAKLLDEVSDFDFTRDGWISYGTYTDPNKKNEFGVSEGYISGYLVAESSKNPLKIPKIFPSIETLKIEDWNTKVDKLLEECEGKNIRCAQGIPSYLLNIFEKAHLRYAGRKLQEIWPNLEYIHYSGTSVEKFKSRFNELFGRELKYFGTYAATEGAFGAMEAISKSSLHFNIQSVVFTFADINAPEGRLLGMHELKAGREYRVHITTPNGLFQYDIGDFVSMHMVNGIPTFNLLGRSNAAINIAAEKVTEEFANRAISLTGKDLGLDISHYFLYPSSNEKGEDIYEWAIILSDNKNIQPQEIALYLDKHLMDLSGDYKEVRLESKVIASPKVVLLPRAIEQQYFDKLHRKGQLKMKQFMTGKEELIALITKVSPGHEQLLQDRP